MLDRRVCSEAVEIRSKENGESVVTGYAAVYDSLSKDLGGFREIIKPGSFRSVLDLNEEVRANRDHNDLYLLGTRSAGTLRLTEDSRGLRWELDWPNTSYANDLKELIKRGDIKGSSFAFAIGKDTYKNDTRGVVREISSFKRLADISIVTEAAYDAAQVTDMRSFKEFCGTCGILDKAKRKLSLLKLLTPRL